MNRIERTKWTNFVESLIEKLSEYEIQKEAGRYDAIKNISDWDENEKGQGFKFFLEKINSQFALGIEFPNAKPTQSELNLLNNALQSILNNRIDYSCKSDALTVKGEFIKLSDAKKQMKVCSKNELEIHGLNKIFIDDDLEEETKGKLMKVTIIGPILEVIGKRKIILDGENRSTKSEKKASLNDHDTRSNEHIENSFIKSGQPAGSLLVIADHLINSKNLFISSNGGKGQDGLKGKQGKAGQNGESPPTNPDFYYNDYYCKTNLCDNGRKILNFKCEKRHCAISVFPYPYPRSILHWCRYRVFGNEATPGFFAENSTKATNGGQRGMIRLIIKKNSTNEVKIANENGAYGIDGEISLGGRGGRNGNNGLVFCKPPSLATGFKTKWSYEGTENINQTASDGRNGSLDDPKTITEPPVTIDMITKLKRYKNYLRSNLNGFSIREKKLIQFYDYLDREQEIKNLYNPLLLANEFIDLEKEYFKLNKENTNRNSLLFFYKSLLKKLDDYVKMPNESKEMIRKSEKKVLNYLYTTLLSKIHFMESYSETNLIIDTKSHLELVMKNLNRLKNMKERNIKMEMINRYKEDYKNQIEAKIDESKKFIENQIKPEMIKLINEADQNIELILNEIIKLKESNEIQSQILYEKKTHLAEILRLKNIFGSLKVIGTIISMFGSVGLFVGVGTVAFSSVAESLILSDKRSSTSDQINEPKKDQLNKLTKDINKITDDLNKMKRIRINQLNESVVEICQEIKQYEMEQKSDEFKDTTLVLKSIKNSLKEFVNFKSIEEVDVMENDLKLELERKENELKDKDDLSQPDGKAKKALKIIEKAKKLFAIGHEVYNRYKSDKRQIDVISDAIKETNFKINQLEQLENEIHTMIWPMLNCMIEDINRIKNSLDKKERVPILISKWKIQSSIKNMKLEVTKMFKQLKVEVNLEFSNFLEKLDESMNMMVKIYDQIQIYQDEQNLANYITNISSDSANAISVTEPEFVKVINQLEFSIRTNLMLKQYHGTIQAFEQYVFPFGSIFLKKIKLPDQLEARRNIEDSIDDVIAEVEKIKDGIEEYKTSIYLHDQYIMSGEFNSNYKTTRPFFVWNNKNYSEIISELFSGKEIMIKSDIKDSPEDREAIKFNFIEINFKAKNETMQNEINEKLKGFIIEATHLGDSHYKFNGQIYTVNTPSQAIKYSFEKNLNSEPVNANNIFFKMRKGDLILSPFCFWKLKLINSTNEVVYSDLKKFRSNIDLELVGSGSYIPRKSKISYLVSSSNPAKRITINELELNKYYKILDSNKSESQAIKNEYVDNPLDHSYDYETRSKKNQAAVYRMNHITNEFEHLKFNENLKLDFNRIHNLADINGQLDTIGNLLLGQIVFHKKGSNKHLHNYLSPDQERGIKINELTRTVIPALKRNFNELNLINQSKWYNNLFN